jgi:hypothetical protein
VSAFVFLSACLAAIGERSELCISCHAEIVGWMDAQNGLDDIGCGILAACPWWHLPVRSCGSQACGVQGKPVFMVGLVDCELVLNHPFASPDWFDGRLS